MGLIQHSFLHGFLLPDVGIINYNPSKNISLSTEIWLCKGVLYDVLSVSAPAQLQKI